MKDNLGKMLVTALVAILITNRVGFVGGLTGKA